MTSARMIAGEDYVSARDLFSIGIGPSSSHTVGPMRAAAQFAARVADLAEGATIRCALYGSLGSTGAGHGTPGAVIAGLAGETPADIDPATVGELQQGAAERRTLVLAGRVHVDLPDGWLTVRPRDVLPRHPNALTLTAHARDGNLLAEETYYSVGGGVVEREGDPGPTRAPRPVPYPFTSGDELLALCAATGLDIAQLCLANEAALGPGDDVRGYLRQIWAVMDRCIENGLTTPGTLPGVLRVPRRAALMADRLRAVDSQGGRDTSHEWLQAYAIAVNEENAAGGRIVTAPTNGAAGIIPAVLRYALDVVPTDSAEPEVDYLLVAAAIGSLYRRNASISGAEAGCQGEVGSASSMAAAGLCHLLGGSPAQVENAAEIAMEHNLGLTCDPVAGLVQLPCIERNAIGAGKAVAAARMAMNSDGTHMISLDTVIETMRQTGNDMSRKYKETSEGGLAVNFVEC